ncbi:hypothetical protein B6I61_21105 [Klebsiella pneumoniae]|uniref:ead/Ea22-like family protein n=1 Tax=Klebsiella pneumoniae TaxID=573 RepID=UPI000C7D3733|nr:ead/Ea22-like family protein [Klebsiella pneumoniae]MDV1422867.1 ead/Ea22-like family protein [Klebsiella pneumoniae]MDV1428367.1 ead/Ea22-like family protein [Klebsiella pneumoniae]MDV1461390.1 ead/Ea22-like family protein [Klebsiella pneumoniae]MDV1577678.1 ead/Ea22-like family protein [Klebsiella pneumoniae]PLD82616.1 hypothetical protein B6I61_21105 [Klebsiella pneumoniae]
MIDITKLTAEKLEEIRQRYRPTLVPKCHICGVEMTIQRMSASRITYGCSGATYDETGCHYAPGRSIADDHYAESRITVVDTSDPDVLTLVEKLEKAQQRIGKLEKKLTDHKRMNQEMAEAMLTPNDSDAAGMEIAALRQRIAELESRTVKLPHRNLGHPKLFLLCPFPYYDAEDMEKALAAAGIKVETE